MCENLDEFDILEWCRMKEEERIEEWIDTLVIDARMMKNSLKEEGRIVRWEQAWLCGATVTITR